MKSSQNRMFTLLRIMTENDSKRDVHMAESNE